MRRSSLYGHILEALDQIRSRLQPADAIMGEFFRARRYLGAADRRYISECVFDILRNFSLLEFWGLEAFKLSGVALPRERLPAVTFLVAYVKLRQGSVEETMPHVADLWRMAGIGIDAGVFLIALDGVRPALEHIPDPTDRLSTLYSMPANVVREWVGQFGPEEAEEACRASNRPAPVTLRVNTLVCTREECEAALVKEGILPQRTPYSPVGLTLSKRTNIRGLATFRAGMFEVQDEGSQLVSMALAPKPGERLVDACAGGGGKTLHCAALMGNVGEIVAIDTDDNRLRELRDRASRARVTIVRSCHADVDRASLDSLAGWADAVLVDAPCSGVGTFRRNPGMKIRFSDQTVQARGREQRSLLDRYAVMVRPGGRLLYATCTLMRHENDDVVREFLASHPEFRAVATDAGVEIPGRIPTSDGSLCLFPHRTGTDGFFIAMLRRPAD